MKTAILLLLLLCVYIYPQSSLFTNNSPTDVVKIDPKGQKFEFVPGVILVKLNDEAVVGLSKRNGLSVTGISSVDLVLQKYKVASAEKLFPNAERSVQKQLLKLYNGKTIERPSLHNIYKLKIQNEQELFQAIDELKQDPNVVYAEPNYILSIVNSEPLSPPLNESEMMHWLKDNPNAIPKTIKGKNPNAPLIITPNDPLYNQQWGLPACQVDAVWDSTTGDTTQIIAILDTGVDWTHPDLAPNIWQNPNPRTSPDANGVVNDIRGWDYINNDNNPIDDNGHGTHVAGIAAAVGNNGIGIAGVNWHAKIMPIKVFEPSGKGDVGTITKGIVYAETHGATVINMSFGAYTRSFAMENALINALSTSVLIAAAGNDEKSIYPPQPSLKDLGAFFPAALSYVLGVQAIGDFTNYDPDGPVYSEYAEGFNYELAAPGSGIMSTFPNGTYRSLSGTSMAAPLVSGSVSLYKSKYPNNSNEQMWGDLIHSASSFNIYSSMFNQQNRSPQLDLVSYNLSDSLKGDDNDGQADAGETIQISVKVRNTWIQGDSVYAEIRNDIGGDLSDAQILKNVVLLGHISPYAKITNEFNPFSICLNPNVPNNRTLHFVVALWAAGFQDTTFQTISIKVTNGSELSGILYNTTILTPNKLWLINNSLRLSTGAVLKILPGTHVILNATFDNRGYVEAIGTNDSLIILENGMSGNINKYVKFILNGASVSGNLFENCELNDGSSIISPIIKNCIFNDFFHGSDYTYEGMFVNVDTLVDCQIINCFTINHGNIKVLLRNNFVNFVDGIYAFPSNSKFNNFCKFTNAYVWSYPNFPDLWYTNYLFHIGSNNTNNIYKNNFILQKDIKAYYVCDATGSADAVNFPNQYWGTNDTLKIQNKIIDFHNSAGLPYLFFEPKLNAPSDSAHGVVWKVLINGKDAQDEIVDPVGVGPQRFDVYFNREMDITYSPKLTFGVRLPYSQQNVSDSTHWASDHKIWTAYKTIQLYTGDGINKLRLSGAQDPEGFEIPIEDTRFSFLISAAGSAANGFNSTAGLGKVSLDWEKPDGVPDLLGFNLYRFNNITDSTFNSPVLINTTLVTDTLFTDYNVIPNKKYYYYYKVVRTDFSESDSSKVISSTPYTAALGDANGDLSVSVLDVLSDVSYILGQNPQPFIFDAADVVRDTSINVLDVVGTVNIVLHGSLKKYLAKETYGNAKLELVGNTLKLNTDISLAGIQIRLKGLGMNNVQFVGQGMTGFELASGNKGDTIKTIIYYNMNNSELQPGSYVLGTLKGVQGQIFLIEAVLADKNGNNVLTNVIDNGLSLIPTDYYLDQNFPNPFNMQTIIQYGVPQKTVGRMVIYNILGQRIKTFELGEINAGRYRIQWDGRNNFGNIVSSGVYIYRFESQKFTLAKKLLLLK